MPATFLEPPATAARPAWRWVHVAVAALAMVATLPGRTHGLGLFTEPLLRSFPIDRERYGLLNLGATLLGALFCLPCGWLLDRLGTRVVLAGVMAALGAVVMAMSRLPGGEAGAFPVALFALILLTRGLGQSALSVASLALAGRAAGRRGGLETGVYAFLTSIGFLAAFTALREVVRADPDDWRTPWAGIGVGVLVAAAVAGVLVRDPDAATEAGTPAGGAGRTLGQALRSGTFWAFALGVSFFGMVSAGTSIFNESLLAERGFGKGVFLAVTLAGIPAGLAANLLGGWLATRVRLGRLLAAGLGLFAAALAAFPAVNAECQAYAYAVAAAAAGGVITVCFFTVWPRAFGAAHLGRIQGAAQLLTVLFSAAGPYLFGAAKTRLGAYTPLFPYLAAAAAGLALFAALLPRTADDRR
jgi:MFS family permease